MLIFLWDYLYKKNRTDITESTCIDRNGEVVKTLKLYHKRTPIEMLTLFLDTLHIQVIDCTGNNLLK